MTYPAPTTLTSNHDTDLDAARAAQHNAEARAAAAEQRAAQAQRIAHHALEQVRQYQIDPVVDLPCRSAWWSHAAQRVRDNPESASVGLLDLDKFKQINDTYGHSAGDWVLYQTARRLVEHCPHGHITRYGGDEFALLATGTPPGQGLLNELAAPIALHTGGTIHITASLGVTRVATAQTTDLAELLHAADIAMYRARHENRPLWMVGS